VIEGALERDGSWESVGVVEGLLDLLVGLIVEEGRLEGEGVGKGDSVGVADGLRDVEGDAEDFFVGVEEGEGVG
jgi:hypothetical protein